MEYNTSRKPLIIPEYGRAVQQMVDFCKTIENKQDRNHFAEVIIDKLGILNPHLRDIPDFKHKLWDHLFVMANYDLDVDSPYPIPTHEVLNSKPKMMKYPTNLDDYRYYGNIIRDMIAAIEDWDNDEKKEGLAIAIANQMKKSYLTWNKDQVDDAVIIKHLQHLSNGKIQLPENIKLVESLDKTRGIMFKSKTKIQNHSKNRNQQKYRSN